MTTTALDSPGAQHIDRVPYLERITRDCIDRRLTPKQASVRLECAVFIAGLVDDEPTPVRPVVWHRLIGRTAVEVRA